VEEGFKLMEEMMMGWGKLCAEAGNYRNFHKIE
jgi:hypothetical protein